jgi:DNA-binding response OmpR family regulator
MHAVTIDHGNRWRHAFCLTKALPRRAARPRKAVHMYAAAVGTFLASDEKALLLAASHASTQLDFTSLDDAADRMEEHAEEPRCVFVSHEGDLGAVVSRLRERASLLTVPVIAFVPHPSEAIYCTAFASGADDALVSGDRGGITRRLANLSSAKPAARTGPHQGIALVASGDIGMRRTLGQTLRRAGFDVSYATEAKELVELARTAPALALVVATQDFPPLGAEAAIRSARTAARKPNLPALVVPAGRAGEWDPSSDLSLGSAGKLLSFAEEVVRGDATDMRISPRLSYPTICAFRPAGVMQPSYGLSHNVSREGFFIRTLDAPKPGTPVWLELRAPESTHMVHLRGHVVWRRDPGAVGATPFGFGLRVKPDDCPSGDLLHYTTGYDILRGLGAPSTN